MCLEGETESRRERQSGIDIGYIKYLLRVGRLGRRLVLAPVCASRPPPTSDLLEQHTALRSVPNGAPSRGSPQPVGSRLRRYRGPIPGSGVSSALHSLDGCRAAQGSHYTKVVVIGGNALMTQDDLN